MSATWSFVTHWNWVYFHITLQSLKMLRNATCARLPFEMTVVRFAAGSRNLLHEYAILITVFQCNWFSLESNGFYFIPLKTLWEEVHRLWQTATKVRTPWLHHTFGCFDYIVSNVLIWARQEKVGIECCLYRFQESVWWCEMRCCLLVAGRQTCEIELGFGVLARFLGTCVWSRVKAAMVLPLPTALVSLLLVIVPQPFLLPFGV